jgi:signal transduction histidine kinase
MGLNFKVFYLSLLLFFFKISGTVAQPGVLRQVPGFPSTEVFDLFTDSKGFLWIGHSGGVSKYDGISFTTYSSPQQTSMRATGLLEDKHGRMWFYNFTGQIFYIENGRVNLLAAYDSKNEPNFPRIGLFKDMLVATTKKGLFICDINTLKCHYETCRNSPEKGTRSLSILSDRVIAYGNNRWFMYKPGEGLKQAYFNKRDTKLIDENVGTLNVETFKDTAFLFCNPASIVYKLTAVNDSLRVCDTPHFKYYINTVAVQNNGYWVNTVKYSVKSAGGNYLKGYDISSLSTDKQGHDWYGSLRTGLMTDYNSDNPFKNPCVLPLVKNDTIQCLVKNGSTLLLGTQNGQLISYDPISGKSTLLIALSAKNNGISYLKVLGKNKILVGSPTHTYIVNAVNHHIDQTYPFLSIKQADTIGHSIIFATSAGLIVQPDKDIPGNYEHWKAEFSKQFKGFNEIDGESFKYWGVEQRTMAVCCLRKTNTIWAACKNGLYKINKAGVVPFYLKNQPVYASCLTAYNNQLVVGTFNNGILLIDGDKVKHLSVEDGLLSNNILQLKIINKDLWVYNNGLVQVLSLDNLKLTNNFQLPGLGDGIVTDADEVNGQSFMASVNGLYKLTRLKGKKDNTRIYPGPLTVNGRDTLAANGLELPSDKNDIQINLEIPALFNGHDISIKYRLSDPGHSNWTVSKPGERNFRFGSLMPGKYRFEALAFAPQLNIASRPVKIDFTILLPWWKRWWAIGGMIAIGAFTIYIISRLYYLNLLTAEKVEFEKKLAIEMERQRISNDMHDDIGASLSAIKLYTSTIQRSPNLSAGVSGIYEMINELSDKTKEVIWSLNKEFDTLESLIYFIDSSAGKLFEHSGISLKTTLPAHIPDINISNEKRRDIFLISKEVMHNVVKHSHGTNVLLLIDIRGDHLVILIADNGIGLQNTPRAKINGQGLINMRKRAQILHGTLHIEATKGTAVTIRIPL